MTYGVHTTALNIAGSAFKGVGYTTLGMGLAGASALAWGSFERRWPTLRHVHVTLDPSRNIQPLTILHVSDLHMFPGQNFIEDFLSKVTATNHIDFVVSTGDNFSSVDGLVPLMRAYTPLLDYPGAYVLGSNDYYSQMPKSWVRYLVGGHPRKARTTPNLPWTELTSAFHEAGWANLTNRADTLSIPVVLAPVAHVSSSSPIAPDASSPSIHEAAHTSQTLSFIGTDDAHLNRDRLPVPLDSWADQQNLRIGLTHAPYTRVLNAMTDAGADLIFAGHTHGGQIGLPGFGAIVTNCDVPRKYAKGLHSWRYGMHQSFVNVSAGLGTSRYAQVRIATRPEATLLSIA